jgi:tetratricopeptide (TPR) repeat protein
MKNRLIPVIVGAALALAALPCCTGHTDFSDLYVLEEYEAASAVHDPGERVERLVIFTKNHAAHPYRVHGYRRVFETIASDLVERERAFRYLDDVLAAERDPKVRGDLYYSRFAFLWGADRASAVSLAGELCEGPEVYYRLFFYLALYLMEDGEQAALAERCFERSIHLAPAGPERAQVMGEYGAFLDGEGRTDEALELLGEATGYGFAYEPLGRILWERGERGKAIEAYIRLAALVPEARRRNSIDSLYALVRPGAADLDERIMARRVFEGDVIPDMEFSDIEGKRFSLGDYRGSPLVLIAFSPT